MTTVTSNTFSVTVASSYNDGDSYTLTGTGFGTKATAAPALSDQFESGSVGAVIGSPDIGLSAWSTTGSGPQLPKYDNEYVHSGSQALLLNFPEGQSNCTAEYKDLSSTDEFYFSYYLRYTRLTGKPAYANWKGARITRGYSGGYLQPSFAAEQFDWANGANYRHYTGDSNTDYRPADFGTEEWESSGSGMEGVSPPSIITQDVWHRVEYYAKLGDVDTANGSAGVWQDYAAVIGNADSIMNRITGYENNYFEWLTLPYFFGEDNETADRGGPAHHKVWVDDVYLDNTIKHVEIGDSATFANCTVREVQRATSWSDTSVTININKGGLPSGTNHVHVVTGLDASGAVTTYAGTVEIS